MRLVIFICARNEAATIGNVVFGNRRAVEAHVESLEVIVIDDGSTDETRAVAREAGARVVGVEKGSGLSNAFRVGIRAALEADPTHLAHTDGDGQYAEDSLMKLCERAASGADLVVGDRLWQRPSGMSD